MTKIIADRDAFILAARMKASRRVMRNTLDYLSALSPYWLEAEDIQSESIVRSVRSVLQSLADLDRDIVGEESRQVPTIDVRGLTYQFTVIANDVLNAAERHGKGEALDIFDSYLTELTEKIRVITSSR